MKLYVASSWRCQHYTSVLEALRADGHSCYDFRNPWPGNQGFKWSDAFQDPDWKNSTQGQFAAALQHPIAQRGFRADFEAMHEADACVMVLPCGRSAHLEAGWFCGRGKPCWIYAPEPTEPELMYLMTTSFCYGSVDLMLMNINRHRLKPYPTIDDDHR